MTYNTWPEDRAGDYFAAPLGASKGGRLRFTNGAHRIVIRTDRYLRGLCRARFGHRMPAIVMQEGIVTIRYPGFPAGDWFSHRPELPAEVTLSARVPWHIQVRGHTSQFVADLRELRLDSLRLEGGAVRLEMLLPVPRGTVPVSILGGAGNVTIRSPEGVALRLRIAGGVTNLHFAGRHTGAAGGELDLRSKGYDDVIDRYDVMVTGGANNLSIESQAGPDGRGVGILA